MFILLNGFAADVSSWDQPASPGVILSYYAITLQLMSSDFSSWETRALPGRRKRGPRIVAAKTRRA
jgi:hypothetical protein